MRHRDEHKQQALLEATLTEVSEHGFAVTSVARIAKAAGMSPGTVYLYYRDKEALLEATFMEVARRIIDVAIEAFSAPLSSEASQSSEAFQPSDAPDHIVSLEMMMSQASSEETLGAATHQLKSALGRVWQALVSLGHREPALFRFHDQFLHSSHMHESLKIANQEKAAVLLDAFAMGKQSGILKQIDLVLIEIFLFRTIYSLLQGEGCQIPPISDESFDQAFEMAWDAIAQRP